MNIPYIALPDISRLAKICVPPNQTYTFVLGYECYFHDQEEHVQIKGGKKGKTIYQVMQILDKKFENRKLSLHGRNDLVMVHFAPSGKNKFRVHTDS